MASLLNVFFFGKHLTLIIRIHIFAFIRLWIKAVLNDTSLSHKEKRYQKVHVWFSNNRLLIH